MRRSMTGKHICISVFKCRLDDSPAFLYCHYLVLSLAIVRDVDSLDVSGDVFDPGLISSSHRFHRDHPLHHALPVTIRSSSNS